eukprot:1185825-Prymnesium_polylepis.1
MRASVQPRAVWRPLHAQRAPSPQLEGGQRVTGVQGAPSSARRALRRACRATPAPTVLQARRRRC